MRQFIGTAAVFAGLALTASTASAQESSVGASRVELSVFPGGGIVFTDGASAPNFGSYTTGASLAYNVNRYVGVEGEGAASIGVDQQLTFSSRRRSVSPPNVFAYNGNALYYPTGRDRRLVPYGAGGIGGLTLFERRSVGVNGTTTFFTGNVGGGAKYYINNRWGLRGDYRFVAVKSKDDAPAFFGRDNRLGHRIYGGVVVNVLR